MIRDLTDDCAVLQGGYWRVQVEQHNPYRHAYAPGALDHLARGFLVTDRRAWAAEQGDIEERWRNHLRRAEGRA